MISVPEMTTAGTFTKAELIKALEMFADDEPIFIVSRYSPIKCGVCRVNYAINAKGEHRCELCVAKYLDLEIKKEGVKDERETDSNRKRS